jgi:hypothetical protein
MIRATNVNLNSQSITEPQFLYSYNNGYSLVVTWPTGMRSREWEQLLEENLRLSIRNKRARSLTFKVNGFERHARKPIL